MKLNDLLNSYRKQAEANTKFSGLRRGKGIPFRHYPPNVQACGWKHLNILCIRHKANLDRDRKTYWRILVATATRLALDELGLRQISKKGFHRVRTMNSIRVALGIRDKRDDQIANNRRKREREARMQEHNMS